MSNIIVLAGGNSSERSISILSGEAVASALRASDHNVETIDPKNSLDTYLPRLKSCDVVFPALHGKGGEDGVTQEYLERHSIKFVGSGGQASKKCFDKFQYAKLLLASTILTPDTKLLNQDEFWQSPLITKPFVLKPNDGGSSINTFIVRDTTLTDKRDIDNAFLVHDKMLLQELIEGVEITVAIIGNEALPIVEIIPPQDEEFDYDNKYNGKTQELCPPQNVPEHLQREAQELALGVHRLTGCRDLSRTDMIITNTSKIYILETNTIPGLTNHSLLPKAAQQSGVSMSELCDKLVQLALKKI